MLSDAQYATETTTGDQHSFGTFGFNNPGGTVTISGIEVKLEASSDTGTGTIAVVLSWNGGVSSTSAKFTAELTNTDTIYTLGGPSDTWGRTWSISDFSDTNFRLGVIAYPSDGANVKIDALQAKVSVVVGGGGGGGGGEI